MMFSVSRLHRKHKRAWHGNGKGRGAVGERAEAEGVCGGVYIMPAWEDFLRGCPGKIP